MLLREEIYINKVMATNGRVGKWKNEEVRSKLVIIITDFRDLGSKSWL